MASQAPIVIQNENLPIFRGIDGKRADAPKPVRTGRQERKALGDLSRVGKVAPIGAPKDFTTFKGKPVALGVGNSKNMAKSSQLTNEELHKCCEWAKEGIELAHFTGNDLQKMLSDKQEERVKRKVMKAMGALHQCTDVLYNIDVPLEEATVDTDDITNMEIVPEFLPTVTYARSRLGDKDIKYLLYDSEFEHEPFTNCKFDLKLKEGYGNDGSHF